MVTEERGTFKNFEKKLIQASFALPLIGGAAISSLSASPSNPEIRSRFAFGCTFTGNVTPSADRSTLTKFFQLRSPKIAVPIRTHVDPSSMATSKSCDMPIESRSMLMAANRRLAIVSRSSRSC